MTDYADYIRIMTDAIHEAGVYVRSSSERTHTEKSNKKDFVTVADIKSQDILRQKLHDSYPDTVVLSEEDNETARQAMYAPDFIGFILDPIDGTYNFKRDMRESAISIGYIERGVIKCGVVYDPYKDELFAAELTHGAFCNGEPIHTSEQTTLAGASVCTSNSYDDEAMARNLRRQLAIYQQTDVMPWTSCPGSGVLIMVWVASGRIDAYHHNGLKPWDNAAAFLIAREAGALVQTLGGVEASFTSPSVLMGTPAIVEILRQTFDQIEPSLLR